MGVCISINKIDKELRPASEMRARPNDEALKDYAEIFDALPPVKLVYDPIAKMHWVQDGYHRLSVAIELGKTEIRAEVTTGDYLDCWKLASRENGSHGVRLTNADKRARVEKALRHPMMCNISNRQIGDLCGVSSTFVDNLYRKLATEDVEDVIAGHQGPWTTSRSSGLPFIIGTTPAGLRLAVVFMIVPDPDYILIRPVTAYPMEE